MLRSTWDSAAKLTTASASRTSGSHSFGVGDVALDEAQPGGLLGIRLCRREIRDVARVRQLVDDGDPGAVAPGKDVPHETRPDEPGPAGHEEMSAGVEAARRVAAHATGRSIGGSRRPAWSSSRASSAARSRDGTVPASAQCPS